MTTCSLEGFRRVALLSILALSVPVAALAEEAVISSATAADLAETARALAPGSSLRIEGTALDGVSEAVGLDLVRFEPVAPGARFVVQTADGPREAAPEIPVYLRGGVDGVANSLVVVSVRSSGEIRGLVSGSEGTWMLARESRGSKEAAVLGSRRIRRQDLADVGSFSCQQLDNPREPRQAPAAPTTGAGTSASVLRLPITYTAQVAVELDYDFYGIFAPDADEAIVYALDLMAFTGTLGEAELGMNVQVPFLQLWTTSSDPFSGGALTRLGQLRTRWNQAGSDYCAGSPCTTINRTTTILLSSAGGGGVAYVPGICDSYHTPTNGFSYAFAGAMNGSFDIDSPGAVWDVVAATHELGHNFGSPHTHCYSPPVDECFGGEDGCYVGPSSLPAGCPGGGQGCATIMGYCHLLGGGIDNVSLTYGAGHPYGTLPDRVPTTMIQRLDHEAALAPACLTATGGLVELEVTRDGSGTGTVTSSPAGIDCGGACRTYFDADTVVTLTPTPGTFSEFAGWSGDADCSDGVVTLSAAASCVATFDGSCGPGNEDCEDNDPCTVDTCVADDHCENSGTPRDPGVCFRNACTKVKIVDSADPRKDKLIWQWKRGDQVDQADLGDPTQDTDYALCVYDATATVATLRTSLSVAAGGAGGSRWSDRDPKGWRFKDRDGLSDGITQLDLRTGSSGKSLVKLKAAGVFLPLPDPFSGAEFFDVDPSVILQLVSSDDQCWTSTFAFEDTAKNTANVYIGRGN